MACISQEHIYTAGELSFLHGFFTPGMSFGKYADCVSYDISKQPLAVQQSLLGDGMSVHCVVAWFTYLVSHMIRIESVAQYLVPLRFSTISGQGVVLVDEELVLLVFGYWRLQL